MIDSAMVAVTTSQAGLVVAVFGASAVEAVEALTFVVAAGLTRGWKPALEGAAAAIALLVVLVSTVGLALIHYAPIDDIRIVVGAMLLIFGMSWLRKAILRTAGHKAHHDEDAIFATTVESLAAAPTPTGRDMAAFGLAFKGVFLEGVEVVLIVVGLGASDHQLALASASAGAAVLLVAVVGALVAKQLSAVPENLIKSFVGIVVTSFGVFWIGEGAKVAWPGSDAFLGVLIAVFAAVAIVGGRALRSVGQRGQAS